MELSKYTLGLMKEVYEKSQELNAIVDKLQSSVKKDTNRGLAVASPLGSHLNIHLVNLSDEIVTDSIMRDLADEGSINQLWESDGKRCYKFTIEGTDCIILSEVDDGE